MGRFCPGSTNKPAKEVKAVGSFFLIMFLYPCQTNLQLRGWRHGVLHPGGSLGSAGEEQHFLQVPSSVGIFTKASGLCSLPREDTISFCRFQKIPLQVRCRGPGSWIWGGEEMFPQICFLNLTWNQLIFWFLCLDLLILPRRPDMNQLGTRAC